MFGVFLFKNNVLSSDFAPLTDHRVGVGAAPVIPLVRTGGVPAHLYTVLRPSGIVGLRPRPVSEGELGAVSPGPVITARAGGVAAQPVFPHRAVEPLEDKVVLSLISDGDQVCLQLEGWVGAHHY